MIPSATSRGRKAGEIVGGEMFPAAGSYSIVSGESPSLPLPIASRLLIVLGLFLPADILVAACKNLPRIQEMANIAPLAPQRANRDNGKNAAPLKRHGLMISGICNKIYVSNNRISIAIQEIGARGKKIRGGLGKKFERSNSCSKWNRASPLVKCVGCIKEHLKALKNKMRHGRHDRFEWRWP